MIRSASSNKNSVVPLGNWSGVRGNWPLVMTDEEVVEPVDLPLPVGLSGDFLIGLCQFHMQWLCRVSGLTETEAKRRVVNLLKVGRIGYQDETGKKRTLPSEAIMWVNHYM